ncbi:hypothetical protein [Nocardia salmonicida]|uniref:hypothetical protein n=1 Tax=Nocardia salmonicida TaxID=53431 RepID=UPI0036418D32
MSAPTPEQLAALARDLCRTAELFDDLDVTITRTDATGPRNTDGVHGGGHDRPMLHNDRASEARRGLLLALRRAATVPPYAVTAMSPQDAARSILDDRLVGWMSTQPSWFGDVVAHLLAAYTTAWGAIDSPARRAIAGYCEECGAVIYAPAHLAVVSCRQCGADHQAKLVRGWMREAAADWTDTAAGLARMLPHFYGAPVTAATIRKWHQRGRLMGCLLADGRTVYRVGHVLALHGAARIRLSPVAA